MSDQTPHLSHSRVNRYLTCPEQYRLYYVEGLRPRFPSANLAFGKVVHGSLARLFQHGEEPVATFLEAWAEQKDTELSYGKRDSWEKLNAAGELVLEKFVEEELPRIASVESVEESFEFNVSSLELPFVGIIDLVADVDGKRTLVDFKTSGSSYSGHEAQLSDQLTAYGLASPEAEQLALCVLVKTKKPKIEWHLTNRSATDVAEYLRKAEYVAREIQAEHFYKRPGLWCSWCDFLPVCLGDEKQAEETLIQLQ